MTVQSSGCPSGLDPGLLLAYLEGDLGGEEVREVETHLEGCSWCRREAESLARARELLLKHPLAFHPDPEDLVRFVADGEDPESEIASHVGSCEHCATDVELVREMLEEGFDLPRSVPSMPRSLMQRLQAPHREVTHEPAQGSLVSTILDLLGRPFRYPMLAVGTAAAAVVILVIILPRTTLFHDVSRTTGLSPLPEQTVNAPAKKLVPTAQVPAEPRDEETAVMDSDREGDGLRQPRPFEQREAETSKPASSVLSKRKVRALRPSRIAEEPALPETKPPSLQRVLPSGAASGTPVETREESSRAVENKLGDMADSSRDRRAYRGGRAEESQVTSGRHSAMEKQTPARSPAPRPASPRYAEGVREPMEVRIIDSKGSDISWSRYQRAPSFAGRPDAAGELKSEERIPYDRSAKEKDTFGQTGAAGEVAGTRPRLLLLIRIEKAGDNYNLEARLLERPAKKTIRTIREETVSKEDLGKRIDALVRRFQTGQ